MCVLRGGRQGRLRLVTIKSASCQKLGALVVPTQHLAPRTYQTWGTPQLFHKQHENPRHREDLFRTYAQIRDQERARCSAETTLGKSARGLKGRQRNLEQEHGPAGAAGTQRLKISPAQLSPSSLPGPEDKTELLQYTLWELLARASV